MEIRVNKEWVIYSSANESGIILGRIPDKQIDSFESANKFAGRKYHYATVFGAIQGLFKMGVNTDEAKSFAELEAKIERIAQECQSAFIKAQSAQEKGNAE